MSNQPLMRKRLTRREILRLMALGGAGAVAAACGAPPTPQIIRETVEVPVTQIIKSTVEVDKLVTATAPPAVKFPGANLVGLMRQVFIPDMIALQQNQMAQWGQMREAAVEPSFSGDWREKIAAAVEAGAGADIGEPMQNSAHIYAEKLVDLSELAESLGARYGGWYEAAEAAAKVDGVWRAIPRAYTTHVMNYRKDVFDAAGVTKAPETYDELLDAATKIADMKDLPRVGFTVSQTGPNDSGSWCYSVLWSHGGSDVDENGKVAINSQATRTALNYMIELSKVSSPDITGFDEAGNNRAFLAGSISATQNATSIYWAAVRNAPDIAKNLEHAKYPAGPAGHHQFIEMNLLTAFSFSQNADAAKDLIGWLMEEDQLSPLAQVGITFYTPLLNYYDDLPNMPWNVDPKLKGMKGLAKGGHLAGWPGLPTRKAGEAYQNQIIVNMFGRAIAGEDVESVITDVESQLKAIYEA